MKPIMTHRLAAAVLFVSLMGGSAALADDAATPTPPLRVLRPVANAVVRETVPIRIAPADVPDDGYVGITIDNVFQTARVLPDKKTGVLFDWDTKAPYTTSDDPDTPKYVADGDHTLKVDLYDRSGNVKGEVTIPVHVANKIIPPAAGIKLAYHWQTDLRLRYLRQTELDSVPATPGYGRANQTLQASLIRFSRSVEDTSGGNYLIRDTVLPNSFLINHGQTLRLEATYNIKSKYRTVSAQGAILRELAPLSPGQHLGFSIPVFPQRKVAVGDSWQAPVQISLDWAGTQTAQVQAESRLEGFEWQNGYPSAKVRETYSGPVTFKTDPGNFTLFDAQTVKYERLIFLAYNSGRLVHTETNVDITADMSSSAVSALGLGGGGVGGYNSAGGGSPYNGLLNDDQDDGPPVPGGYPGAGMYPGGGMPMGGGGYPGLGGGYPGAAMYPGGGGNFGGGMFSKGNFGRPNLAAMPGGMYSGGGMPMGGGGYPGGIGYGGQGAQQTTSTKLKVTEITNLQP